MLLVLSMRLSLLQLVIIVFLLWCV